MALATSQGRLVRCMGPAFQRVKHVADNLAPDAVALVVRNQFGEDLFSRLFNA